MPASKFTNSIIVSLFCLCACININAQTMHSFNAGIGTADIMDTYLSPYAYKGTNYHLLWNSQRMVRACGIENLNFQTILDVDASILDNPAKNINEYSGGVRFALGWTKTIKTWDIKKSKVSVEVGPMTSIYAGGIYNERNGNNPAQAKADLMIDFTAKAKWQFSLFKKNMQLDYQIIMPFAGIAFSPNYGQSYYEAFYKDNYDHNVVFANFVNMPSIRHMINLDVPLRKHSMTALRIGYQGYFMQSKFNKLRYHSYTNSFTIGFTKYFKRL